MIKWCDSSGDNVIWLGSGVGGAQKTRKSGMAGRRESGVGDGFEGNPQKQKGRREINSGALADLNCKL